MKQQLGTYKEFTYILNGESGYFEKEPSLIPFKKLPFELKMEQSQENYLKRIGAKILLRSRTKNGKKQFHTGLIPLSEPHFYQGDFVEFVKGQKVKSLIIFELHSSWVLKVYFFNRYYIDRSDVRQERCNQFVKRIKGAN